MFCHLELPTCVKGIFLHYHTLKTDTDQDYKIFRLMSLNLNLNGAFTCYVS